MNSRDFCYWLQGFFEINELNNTSNELNDKQVKCIKNHLSMVFAHEIDPSFGDKDHQELLNILHADPDKAVNIHTDPDSSVNLHADPDYLKKLAQAVKSLGERLETPEGRESMKEAIAKTKQKMIDIKTQHMPINLPTPKVYTC